MMLSFLCQRQSHRVIPQLRASFSVPLVSQRVLSSTRFTDWNRLNDLSPSYNCNRTRFKDGEVKNISRMAFLKTGCRLMHTADDLKQKIDIGIPMVVQQARANLASVRMMELKNAPVPVFWWGMAGLAPYVLPVFIQIFTGHLPIFGTAQLFYSATILSYLGGVKYGSMVQCDKKDCTWENMALATIPALCAWIGLLMPEVFAFLAVGAGMLASLAIDLATSKYPPWFFSLRCFLTFSAVFFLLIGFKNALFGI